MISLYIPPHGAVILRGPDGSEHRITRATVPQSTEVWEPVRDQAGNAVGGVIRNPRQGRHRVAILIPDDWQVRRVSNLQETRA